jgi:hypothetical protein
MKQRGFRYCSTCHSKLQKWGKTKAGTPRWRCPQCTSTNTRARPDIAKALILERFVTWLLGKQSQTEVAGSANAARTWRMRTAWCWNIVPKPVLTGEQYPILLLDGIRVGSLVCLIVRTPAYVVAWHWAPYEASTTWDKLLLQLPVPFVVVCDGQKGILLAIARCWPQAAIQRCHFHVWQNVRTKLTLNPQTEAGKQLLWLMKGLLKGLATREQTNLWIGYLEVWEQTHGSFLRERTYTENPRPGKRKWRYTHERLRSAYRQLAKLLRQDQLFTYLDDKLLLQTQQPIPRTTNYVEGGINSQLRTKLKLHRGMSEEHQRRLVEWYLYSRTEDPKPTRKFL